MAFEPTPGRGAPNASYTGVGPQQDSPVSASQQEPSVSTTQPPELPAGSSAGLPEEPGLTPPVADGPSSTPTSVPSAPAGRGWSGWVLYALAGAAIGYVVIVLGGRRLLRVRRRRAARSANARIDLAWREAVESLRMLGLSSAVAETPQEFAERAERRTRHSDPAFRHLAELATEARYSGRPATDAEVESARNGSVAVLERVRAETTVPQRLGYELSPRHLLKPLRRPRTRIHS
jgi:hypothetical protein